MGLPRALCQYAFSNPIKCIMGKHKDNACYSHEDSYESWKWLHDYPDDFGLPGLYKRLVRTLCKITFPNTVKRIKEEYETQMCSYVYCDEEDDKDDIQLVPSEHGMQAIHFIDDIHDGIREIAWEKIKNKDNAKYVKFRSNKHHGCRPILLHLCCSRMYRPRNILEREAIRLMKERGWDDKSIAKYLKSICDIFYIESIGNIIHRPVATGSIQIRKMEDYHETMDYFWGHKEQGK
jgi:hypothetical protein